VGATTYARISTARPVIRFLRTGTLARIARHVAIPDPYFAHTHCAERMMLLCIFLFSFSRSYIRLSFPPISACARRCLLIYLYRHAPLAYYTVFSACLVPEHDAYSLIYLPHAWHTHYYRTPQTPLLYCRSLATTALFTCLPYLRLRHIIYLPLHMLISRTCLPPGTCCNAPAAFSVPFALCSSL